MFEISQTFPMLLLFTHVPQASILPPFWSNFSESFLTSYFPESTRHSTPLFIRKTFTSSFFSSARLENLNAFHAFSGSFELITTASFAISTAPSLKALGKVLDQRLAHQVERLDDLRV